jgi:hypothetical protein
LKLSPVAVAVPLAVVVDAVTEDALVVVDTTEVERLELELDALELFELEMAEVAVVVAWEVAESVVEISSLRTALASIGWSRQRTASTRKK